MTERYEQGNVLIDTLPLLDREHVSRYLGVSAVEVPDCVIAHGSRFGDVLFPIDAVFSVTAELRQGDAYEVAATGRQGLIGAELALGFHTAPRSVMTQVEGRTASMPGEAFSRCVHDSEALARAVHRHLLRRLFVAEQFIACNFAHDVTQRCARWVLMLHDEIGRDEFALRHEFLGMMLGLRPRAAAQAAEVLTAMGVVRYSGEALAVLDRDALLETACECYEAQRRFAPAAR